ncbi:hypothetical protein KT71_03302 [Congregibacter litoralis KT71]|uniref:Uncharacterized protein n=1 Tax=Congregibacter litoralis KT71 TaxID=314285 RepID=A4A7H2_9GAMM|nr:hypothetical protein KT71_03302 [Congregibacter litoralis KT71]
MRSSHGFDREVLLRRLVTAIVVAGLALALLELL